jgi:hypothetical protein
MHLSRASQLPAFLLLLLLAATTATTAAPSCPPSKAGTTYGERYTYLEADIAAAQKEGKGALANPLFAAAAAYDLPRVKCLVEQVCFCVWVEGLFHERGS